jgi:hypothetical protein
LLIERFLEGSATGDPDKFGQTLKEEKMESGTILSFVINQRIQQSTQSNQMKFQLNYHLLLLFCVYFLKELVNGPISI